MHEFFIEEVKLEGLLERYAVIRPVLEDVKEIL